MIEEFTVNKISTGYYEDRKSEFTAFLTPISSLEEFKIFTNSLRAKHKEMCHFCSAVRLRIPTLTEKASDDGEPSGTAGRPILQILQRKNLMNCGIVVMRKFGGTLLGTGGLVKAYSSSAKLSVENAVVGKTVEMKNIFFTTDYSLWSKLEAPVREFDSKPTLEYTDKIKVSIFIEPENISKIKDVLREISSGKIIYEIGASKFVFKAL